MRSESIHEPSPHESDFYPMLQLLLRKAWTRTESLRLVGVRLTNLHAALPEPELALTGLPQKCYGKTSISGSFGPLAPEIRKKGNSTGP